MNGVNLNFTHVSDNMTSLWQQAHSQHLTWRPDVSAHGSPGLCRLFVKSGAIGVAVTTIEQGVRLASHVPSVLVNLPPAFDDLPRLNKWDMSTELLLSVDHFVQAEKIAAATVETPQKIVISIDTGSQTTGIRPGHDAVELAEGITRLPGLCVAGLSTTLSPHTDIRSAIRALEHTRQELTNRKIDCSLISLNDVSDWPIIPGSSIHTETQRSDVFGQPVDRAQPTISIQAQVISRPSLDRAVLYHGLARGTMPEAWLADFPQAVICQWTNEYCVVAAAAEPAGLQIGDVVRIGVNDPTGSLLRAQGASSE